MPAHAKIAAPGSPAARSAHPPSNRKDPCPLFMPVQEESGMWCYREESSGRRELEGPYTVAELRDLHRR